MAIAFDPVIVSLANSPDDIYAFKFLPGPGILDCFPAGGAGIFALQVCVYAAFVNVHALSIRDSFQPVSIFGALYIRFFAVGKSLFFSVIFIFWSMENTACGLQSKIPASS